MSRAALALIALMGLALVVFSQQSKISPALRSLVDAERAFAKMGAEKGVRDSFIAYFAEDGINFTPHPVKTKENLSRQPAPAGPRQATLNWEPVYGDISRAGDIGYSTGPYWITENKPGGKIIGQGFFSSIWKKQPDGQWKVVVDLGIRTPEPPNLSAPFTFQAARSVKAKGAKENGDLESGSAALMNVDRQFLGATQSSPAIEAYMKYLSDDARLHRDGIMPLTGKEAIHTFLSRKDFSMSGEPIKADVAKSNDFGYTVGRYELKEKGAAAIQKGYYFRVWKRGQDGKWKVVFDVANVVPPEAGSSSGE